MFLRNNSTAQNLRLKMITKNKAGIATQTSNQKHPSISHVIYNTRLPHEHQWTHINITMKTYMVRCCHICFSSLSNKNTIKNCSCLQILVISVQKIQHQIETQLSKTPLQMSALRMDICFPINNHTELNAATLARIQREGKDKRKLIPITIKLIPIAIKCITRTSINSCHSSVCS